MKRRTVDRIMLAAAVVWLLGMVVIPLYCRHWLYSIYDAAFQAFTDGKHKTPPWDTPWMGVFSESTTPWICWTVCFAGVILALWVVRLNLRN